MKRILAIEIEDFGNNIGFYTQLTKTVINERGVKMEFVTLRVHGECTVLNGHYEWTKQDSVDHFLRLNGCDNQ